MTASLLQEKFDLCHLSFKAEKMPSMKVEVVGPNEALIISGFMHSPPTMIVGGRALVIPCIHKVQKLQLSTMTLAIKTERVYTNLGVPICVTGIAQVNFKLCL